MTLIGLYPAKIMRALCLSALLFSFMISAGIARADKTYRLPISLTDQDSIGIFYADREGEPLWVENYRLNEQARALITVLRQAWMNGLNPASYHVEIIANMIGDDLRAKIGSEQAVPLEMILTDAYIKYRRDLSGMRIKARDMNLRAEQWRQRVSVDQALLDLKQHHNEIAEFLLEAEPQGRTYQTLKTELVRLTEKSSHEDVRPIYFKQLMSLGKGDGNIPLLRARFDLPSVPEEQKYTYDAKLVEAVKDFQNEQGLKADGIIGKQTEEALNRTNASKIRQLIVNLERLRWIEEQKPDRFIVVNLPSATLWAIEKGEVKAEMPVIIGRKKRPTESFVTQIHGVRFNPTWTVPPTIKREDIVPQLVENSEYLIDKGMEIYQETEEGKITIDPSSVDWESLSEAEMHKFTMVQTSGDHNPLGRIRVLMPNEFNIYLHDTNHHGLFSSSNRAQSSGCVRMKYPEKVADFILKQRSNWNTDKMIELLKSGEMKDLYIQETIPVYLLYNTVWLGDKNQVIYGSDVYDDDKKLWQVLEKLDGFANINHNEVIAGKTVD